MGQDCSLSSPDYDYLTIRLRALNFYEVIVDEGEARIALVESEIKHNILHKNIKKRELKAIVFKKMRQENDCFATRYLSRSR